MVRIVRAKEKTKKKPGRPTKLRIEDQILSDPYRNRHRRFGLRSNLIAGICNYELAL
ncbi:hypothetical protein H1P_970015 [Hyella patelloides LEGE 07179]|uniref:Uncharacterized protein n=1 Tax=Hyella patelloides LEGE 07179 TaxID=945734 RepID=A0A563W5G7_9CYAN|nr:hypothetical protein H1P_970015 [Hyella patelloides LEGE 07179]